MITSHAWILGAGLAVSTTPGEAISGSISTVATFAARAQVCLPNPEKTHDELLLALRDSSSSVAVTLVGYSDTIEMKSREWDGSAACLQRQLPSYLRGHERIAATRALAVYEVGHANGVPGFAGPPVLVFSAQDDYRSRDPKVVVILLRRAQCAGVSCRKVDLSRVDMETRSEVPMRPCHEHPVLVPLPPTPPPTTLDPPVVPPSPQGSPPIAWASITLGTAVTTAGSVFLGLAARQRAAARGAGDREREDLLELDGYRYVRSGGWALGVGLGLVSAGVTMLFLDRHQRRSGGARGPASRRARRG